MPGCRGMTIAMEVARTLTEQEISIMESLLNGAPVENAKIIKRLKALGIHDPKSKRPLTLYGTRVVDYLKEYGRWPN